MALHGLHIRPRSLLHTFDSTFYAPACCNVKFVNRLGTIDTSFNSKHHSAFGLEFLYFNT